MVRFGLPLRFGVVLLAAGGALSCSRGTAPPERPFTTFGPADLAKPLPSPVPEVAARVNGQPIPTRNVAVAVRQLTTGEITDDKRAALMRQGLYRLIVRELLFQEASRRRLVPDEKAMGAAYDEARVPYKEDAAWQSFLASQGMDEATLRAELRVQYTVRALMDQEAAKVPPEAGTEEARRFYDSHPESFESGERLRASHIQLRVPEGTPLARRQEVRTRLEGILVRARRREDFAKLARQYSEDPGSNARGGELQVFARGELHPNFERAAFALKPGEVSDVVETPFGFHIVKLHERLPSVRRPFDEVEGRVKQFLVQQRRDQGLEQLVTELKAKARIETYL